MDLINKIYAIGESPQTCAVRKENGVGWENVFFDFWGRNLQEHTLVFSHDDVLNLKKNAWIELCFYQRETRLVPEEILKELVTDENARIEYFSEEGYLPFAEKVVRDGRLLLYKNEKQPSFTRTVIGDRTGFVIKFTVREIGRLKDMETERFFVKAKGLGIACDTVSSNGVESNQAQFFPFGERLSLYSEVYFGSEEVFGKKGAKITMSFNVDYASIPLEYNQADEPIDWKWITDRSSIKPNPEYDVTIAEIIWEYFNGSGWARLFEDNRFNNLFSTENGAIGQYKTISFTCPEDISPILINAAESCYIRARILKINNLYKMKGNYISPVLTNISLSYDYGDTWMEPELLSLPIS